MLRRNLLLTLVAVWFVAANACARRHANEGDNSTGGFDYYVLALSWAPQFCASQGGDPSSNECDPVRHYGFVVHGLWPQNDDGSYPQHCAQTRPVQADTVQQLLSIMPSLRLIEHEWATHGTCTGLSPRSYFATIEKAFTNLQIPSEYRTVSRPMTINPAQMEKAFAEANHATQAAFGVSCKRSEFVALYVCLAKDLHYRSCGTALRECRASQIDIRPML
ncbi:MAG TPA: ribonuclease T2 [Terriglobales bacterium]|jgi:ribonuclease T2|nr:ribonuclease T2 [Terriglobales bacterium]